MQFDIDFVTAPQCWCSVVSYCNIANNDQHCPQFEVQICYRTSIMWIIITLPRNILTIIRSSEYYAYCYAAYCGKWKCFSGFSIYLQEAKCIVMFGFCVYAF